MLDDRHREHRRRDPRDHHRPGHRPARGDDRGRRRRVRAQHRPDRPRARAAARVLLPTHGRRAQRLRRAVLRHHLGVLGRAATPRPAGSTSTRSTTALARRRSASAEAFLDGLATSARSATRSEFLGRGPLPAAGVGAGCPAPGSRFEADGRTCARSRRRSTTTHERVFAVREPGQYLECLALEGAGHRRARQAGAARPRGARAGRGGAGRARPAYFRETRARPTCRATTASDLPAGARDRGPGDHPRADHDGRRLPGLARRRHAARQLPARHRPPAAGRTGDAPCAGGAAS